jgi:pimeloyl-ACP methyl ester carboxylesterase
VSRARWLTAILAALVLLAACGGGGDESGAPAGEPSGANDPSGTPSPTDDAVAVTGVGADADPAGFVPEPLEWSDCDDGIECATLAVPLDHADPGGPTIDLALARRHVGGGGSQGNLLVNPGGPGASGVEFVRLGGGLFEDVAPGFDLIGFDPRGVAGSTPVDCLSDQELDDFLALDLSPDDQAEMTALLDGAAAFRAGCLERSGDLLAHVSTADVVDDMDLIRRALGDDQLTYVGFSYGTLLGVRYLERYPDHVRAFVLDGAVDPTLSGDDLSLGQAEGFQQAIRSFLADCRADADCPFSGSDNEADLVEILDRLEDVPLLTRDGREVGPGLAELAIIAATYSEATWGLLAEGLADARLGDGDVLLFLADYFTERDNSGHFTNSWEALFAVNCLDEPPATEDQLAALAARAGAEVDLFGESTAWFGAPCIDWPVQGRTDPRTVDIEPGLPVVVIGTTGDPATPYEWAVSTAADIEGSALFTREGEGHTAIGSSACIDAAVASFLVDPTVPDDFRC